MELQEYIRIFRKWLWLILVATFVGGGLGFVVASRRPPEYSAQTIISIGRVIDQQNVTSGDIRLGIDLAPTYVQLLGARDLLQAVIDRLSLQMSTSNLSNTFKTSVPTGTSLLQIQVTYNDPVLASSIANALAEELIQSSPSNLTQDQQQQVTLGNQQISDLTKQITAQRETLAQYDGQLAAATNADDIARITQLRSGVIDQINQATTSIAQFQSTISNIQQGTNSLTIVERAIVPTTPSGTGVVTTTLTGAAVAVALIVGVVLLIEYLDDRIKSPEIAVQALAIPVLGAIPQFGKRDAPYPDRLITSVESMSPEAEAYRRLRTNLMITSANGNGKKSVIVITSPGPSEGKSVTTANLAVTMALAGVQVLLIDADLRRPKLHVIFGLKNDIGLTTLLLAEDSSKSEDNESQVYKHLRECLQQTEVPKLRVITTGFTPSNPSEVLGSALMQRWISTFRSTNNIDVVIIDTPPALLFSDSSLIASVTEADVVLVIDGRRTRRWAALQTKEQFEQLGMKIKGTVMNRLDPGEQSGRYNNYGYGYGYYYAQPDGEDGKEKKRGLLGFLRR
ncbi:MAG: polysaccharide biosynthesis tyrosine autokinase [Chloroflexota bacterium]